MHELAPITTNMLYQYEKKNYEFSTNPNCCTNKYECLNQKIHYKQLYEPVRTICNELEFLRERIRMNTNVKVFPFVLHSCCTFLTVWMRHYYTPPKNWATLDGKIVDLEIAVKFEMQDAQT